MLFIIELFDKYQEMAVQRVVILQHRGVLLPLQSAQCFFYSGKS